MRRLIDKLGPTHSGNSSITTVANTAGKGSHDDLLKVGASTVGCGSQARAIRDDDRRRARIKGPAEGLLSKKPRFKRCQKMNCG
jgi:hypothetical protein